MIHGGKRGAPITELEMGILWWKAQGLPYHAVAFRVGTTTESAQSAGQRVMRKLGAQDITHAVFLAALRGIIGPYVDCGSLGARKRHEARGEPVCARCRRT
jgi:DNA-binding CsgD family transcriptional regulator